VAYDPHSIEGRFLDGEIEAHGRVIRWIALVLTSPRFHRLRGERQDLQQEVLRRILDNLRKEKFDAMLDFRVYVQSIAYNTARESVRRWLRTHRADLPVLGEAGEETGIEEAVVYRELAAHVLETAPEGCKQLFRMFFYEQLGYARIAQTLKMPVGTAKSRLFRCLKKAYLYLAARSGDRQDEDLDKNLDLPGTHPGRRASN